MLRALVSVSRSSVVLAAAVTGLVALGGCGSEPDARLPPAAEPPRSPVPTQPPAGDVTPVGKRPEGIVADGPTGVVAVALRRPARLALVDGASGRVLRRVSLPGAPRHLALAGPGGPVLVPAEDDDRLDQVALPGARVDGHRVPVGRIVASAKVGRQPHDATPVAGGRVAVGAELGNLLQIVAGDRVVAERRIALQPGGLASFDGGRIVAVVAVRERVLQLYDAASLKPLASVPAGVGPTHVVCRDEGVCYVADTTGRSILIFVYAHGKLELQRRQYLSSNPYGIALDEQRQKLWVTLPARNQLVELRARRASRTDRIFATVQQPQSVAVDPRTGHVFVTGATHGELQRLRP